MTQELMRKVVSDAFWDVSRGHDGRLLTGDFHPGHDAIVDAICAALLRASAAEGAGHE